MNSWTPLTLPEPVNGTAHWSVIPAAKICDVIQVMDGPRSPDLFISFRKRKPSMDKKWLCYHNIPSDVVRTLCHMKNPHRYFIDEIRDWYAHATLTPSLNTALSRIVASHTLNAHLFGKDEVTRQWRQDYLTNLQGGVYF